MLVSALGLERRKLPTSHLGWQRILGTWGGLPTAAGPVVNEANAISLATVFSAVSLYGRLVAHLPLVLYQRTGESRRRATEKPLYRLLHNLANPRTTAFQARSFLMSQVLLRGNWLAFVERNRRGETMNLWPLRWDRVTVDRLPDPDGRLVYHWRGDDTAGQDFLEDQVWHQIGFTQDGVMGLSAVAACRETIGAAIAAREYASRFWSNIGVPAGVLTHPDKLGRTPTERDAAAERLRSRFDELYVGTEGAHRTAILEEGMKFEKIGLDPAATQVLEARRFAREEIAALFGIPPHLIGHLERATFGNIEQQSLELVIYHLTPWLVSIEQTIERDLLTEAERDQGYFVKHTVDGLLRGDSTARANFYRTAIQTPWMTLNEVRALEDLEPLEDGDDLRFPMNVSNDPGGNPQLGTEIGTPPAAPALRAALPAPPPPAPAALPAPAESRAISRPALARAFRGVLEDAFGRLVRAEVRELKKKIPVHDLRSEDSLQIDLEAFYAPGSEFSELASRILRPGITALARASFEGAAGQSVSRERLEEFLAALVGAAIGRTAIASRIALVSATQARTEGPSARQRLEELFAAWITDRPAKAAAHESVQVSRAAAVEAFRRGGAERKVWTSIGRDCEFCQALDGAETALGAMFIEAGQTLVGTNGGTLQVQHGIGHAPLHRGCDCDVVAA